MFLSGTMEVNNEGMLKIGGVTAEELRDKYGTPLLVFDEKLILKKIKLYKKAVSSYPGPSQIIYASKAFLCQGLAALINQTGLALDIVSGGELYRARKGGFPPDKMFFHGNNKLPEELKEAIQAGVAVFVIDNAQEARLLAELARGFKKQLFCQLRVTPGIAARTHDYIKTGQKTSKFGVGIETGQAEELALWIENEEFLNLQGIHSHIGSQIYDSRPFRELIWTLLQFLLDLRRHHGLILKDVNLGGGIGSPQTAQDSRVDIISLVAEVAEELASTCRREGYPYPRLLLEPGRSIVGEAGTTLYTVGSIKEVNNSKNYLAVDGGMSDNIRPALYDAVYEGFLANRCREKPEIRAAVVGKCCESGDVLIEETELPRPRPGDILAVPATGAYSYSMASNYNGITRPAVVIVKAGKAEPLIARETRKDLIRLDRIPSRFQQL